MITTNGYSTILHWVLTIISWWQWSDPVQYSMYLKPDDLDQFPSREVCQEYVRIAREHRTYLKHMKTLYPADAYYYHTWYMEAYRLEMLWDALDTAHFTRYGDPSRYLLTLFYALGKENYYHGRMPPPVPLEYFRSIP